MTGLKEIGVLLVEGLAAVARFNFAASYVAEALNKGSRKGRRAPVGVWPSAS
jgi:hypothetical protein